jgi:putative transcriptional regulator
MADAVANTRLSSKRHAQEVVPRMERNPEETLDVLPEGDSQGPQSIRDLRSKLGMTQEEFAHAIAVTVSTVNRWENGHANPSKLAWRAIQGLARKRGTTVGGKRD